MPIMSLYLCSGHHLQQPRWSDPRHKSGQNERGRRGQVAAVEERERNSEKTSPQAEVHHEEITKEDVDRFMRALCLTASFLSAITDTRTPHDHHLSHSLQDLRLTINCTTEIRPWGGHTKPGLRPLSRSTHDEFWTKLIIIHLEQQWKKAKVLFYFIVTFIQ